MRQFKVFVLGLLLALSAVVQTTTAQYLPTDARAFNGTRVPFPIATEKPKTAPLVEQVGAIGLSGDKFRIATAEVMVTQPRMPCYKLGLKFGRPDIIKRFLQSERTGFYLAVLKEGEVGAGDEFEPLARDANDVRVSDITRLYTREKHNETLLSRAIEVEALPESWRGYFQHQLEKLSSSEH
jgi:hypothetical protein